METHKPVLNVSRTSILLPLVCISALECMHVPLFEGHGNQTGNHKGKKEAKDQYRFTAQVE